MIDGRCSGTDLEGCGRGLIVGHPGLWLGQLRNTTNIFRKMSRGRVEVRTGHRLVSVALVIRHHENIPNQ